MAAINPVNMEARYYRKEGDTFVCELCPRGCRLGEGQTGACGTRRVEGGKMIAGTYGRVSSIAIDPMEKKPLYHYLPRSKIFSIGSIGCNLFCRHCQNYAISQSFSGKKRTTYKSPEEIVTMCRKEGSTAMAFTYNEPSLWFEYIMDVAAIAPDLRLVVISNGIINQGPLDELCDVVGAFNIDVKAFDDDFYINVCGGHLDDVLRSVRTIFDRGVHLELTYLVIPGYNDDDESFLDLANWMIDNLSPDVPLHFNRFHPDHQMVDVPWTPIDTLMRAKKIAVEAGLNYVYIGNAMIEDGSDTICPHCGTVLVERIGFLVETVGLDGDRCQGCGAAIPIRR